ncbi:zinc finger CCCH domain-containing protein [Salix suchowensis]|nr:zinc finger CCCH domain-containing protein [Salix suchowensis]
MTAKEEEEEEEETTAMSRKAKRKEKKKLKRKQVRREIAEKEREEEERRLNDPEEQRRWKEMEEEEKERMERERKSSRRDGKENGCDEDDDWEYIEEGPAEIIWQENEIIVRKKKVRVPKKNADRQGTKEDKAHCPFHLKTGACRFGQRCSRVHFYPDKSCTLLIKNMYNGPGLAWEQDEGLEYTDEEVEHSYEEFYEDVHTEFLKYGEIVNFKVCKNGSFHLRGNVYVHYKSLDSAILAHHSINGRYFAGKQIKCEFINLTRWKVAICGEFMKSRLKTCSHGSACNFIHCFRNPGGDYEWADWDRPAPRYWLEKMASLFGYSAESLFEKQTVEEKLRQTRISSNMLTADRDRSRSRGMDHAIHSSHKSGDIEDDFPEGTQWRSHSKDDGSNSDGRQSDRDTERERDRDRYRHRYHARKRSKHHSKVSEHSPDYRENNSRSHEIDQNEELSDDGRIRHEHFGSTKSSGHWTRTFVDDDKDSKDETRRMDAYRLDRDIKREKSRNHTGKSSRHQSRVRSRDDHGDDGRRTHDIDPSREGFPRDRDRRHHIRKSLGNQNNVLEFPDDHQDNGSRIYGTNSSNDMLNRDRVRHFGHGRKHSEHSEPEFSDDEGASVKRLKGKSLVDKSDTTKSNLQRNPTGGRNYSSKETVDVNSPVESHKPDRNHVYGQVKWESNSPGSRYNFSEEIDEQDRWEPESYEKDHDFKRTSVSVDSYESGSQCDRRSESYDKNSDYSHGEKMETDAWEYETGASGKRHKSRSDLTVGDDKYAGTSSFLDKTSSELYNESKPWSSKWTRHKRNPKCLEEGRDSPKESPEKEKKIENQHAKLRSRRPGQDDKEYNS